MQLRMRSIGCNCQPIICAVFQRCNIPEMAATQTPARIIGWAARGGPPRGRHRGAQWHTGPFYGRIRSMETTGRLQLWRGPPLVLQIMALLLGGLVIAQLVTLFLTLVLPPAPQPA